MEYTLETRLDTSGLVEMMAREKYRILEFGTGSNAYYVVEKFSPYSMCLSSGPSGQWIMATTLEFKSIEEADKFVKECMKEDKITSNPKVVKLYE